MRKSALFALAPVAGAVVIAGCGGSAGSSNRTGYLQAAPTNAAGAAPTVALAPCKFGKILVDDHGRTLYDYYAGDTKPCQTTGQNISQFGALWYVLTRNGTEITNG